MDVKYTIYVPHTDHIGPAIRAFRELAGLSQPALAKLAGVHSRTISRHEMGVSLSIDQGILERIAVALGVPTECLWEKAAGAAFTKKKRGRPRKNLAPLDD